jgi:hypothetical protein
MQREPILWFGGGGRTMRTLAGSILFLAASVALAGGLIAQALDKSGSLTYGMVGVLAGLVMGILGLGTLISGLSSDRRE